MLYAFGFGQVGVVAGDLYFLDPNPAPGQEGPEQGVRVEVRVFDRTELRGSMYSAQPIAIERPIWRADLLETVTHPRSLDRAHHHPRFDGWEPGYRHFDASLTADPVAWLGKYLTDPDTLLEQAGVSLDEVGRADRDDLRAAAPEIVDVVRRTLERVWAGELAQPPDGSGTGARAGWL
jgi:hypothetical protein